MGDSYSFSYKESDVRVVPVTTLRAISYLVCALLSFQKKESSRYGYNRTEC